MGRNNGIPGEILQTKNRILRSVRMIAVNPKVSIIITNYNGQHYLKDCLDSINAQSFTSFEVILVDNHSSDGSIRIVEREYPEIELIRNDANFGFARGTNEGIRASRGEFILTLNNDTRLEPGFLEEIMRPTERDALIGICAAKMLYPDGRINSTGTCISRSGAAWDRGISQPDHGQYGHSEEVFGACAGAALYRKRMLDEIGLFDEDFFMYMEDVDLAFRARLAGWKCIYIPGAVVIHHHGGTAGVGSDTAVYYGNRNMVWVAFRNFPRTLLISSLPWIIGRTFGVIIYHTFRGQLRIIVEAKIDAFRGLHGAIQKRRMNIHNIPDHLVSQWVYPWYSPGRR